MQIKKQEVRSVDLNRLRVDDSYQRDPKLSHIRVIREGFDAEAFGFPLVGEREDGTLWVIDGLQRITAAKAKGVGSVYCEIVASLGPEHEASLFRMRAKRLNLTALQLFKSRLTEKEPEALKISEVVHSVGLAISGLETPGHAGVLQSINSVQGAFRLGGPDHLALVLSLLKKAWGGQHSNCYHGAMVGGLSLFLHKYKGEVDVDRLASKMAAKSPSHLIGMSEPHRIATGGRDHAVGKAFLQYYNLGLRKKLADWKAGKEAWQSKQ